MEIVMTQVVIECVVPRPRTHLFGTIGHAIHFSPASLDTFPVRSTNTGFQVQRMGRLAGDFVHGTVTFGYPPTKVHGWR